MPWVALPEKYWGREVERQTRGKTNHNRNSKLGKRASKPFAVLWALTENTYLAVSSEIYNVKDRWKESTWAPPTGESDPPKNKIKK